VRAAALFIIALLLSVAIHGLVLFTPSRSVPESFTGTETYRVNLAQMPARNVGYEKLEGKPVSIENQEKPKPPQDSVKPRTTETKKSEPTDDPGEEKTADSRFKKDLNQVTDGREQVPISNTVRWTDGRLPGTPDNFVPSPRTDYQRILDELNRLLRENLHYPEAARRKGIEGSLAVTFILNTDGKHLDMVVSETSGSPLLDRAAVRSISAIFPYPDPPDTPLRFTIPVTYRLTGSE
jgi:protein TonB